MLSDVDGHASAIISSDRELLCTNARTQESSKSFLLEGDGPSILKAILDLDATGRESVYMNWEGSDEELGVSRGINRLQSLSRSRHTEAIDKWL